MRHLHSIGWTPMEDEEGDLDLFGTTADGRKTIALYGEESIITDPASTRSTEPSATSADQQEFSFSDGDAAAK